MVVKCTNECIKEFQKNPKAFCEKYGIKEQDLDQKLIRECKTLSTNECRELLKKSRCSTMFDFSVV